MPDAIFESLYADTVHLCPTPVEQVKARGRQRARRQRIASVTAVFVVVAMISGGIAIANRDGPDHLPDEVATAAPSTSSTEPAPTEPVTSPTRPAPPAQPSTTPPPTVLKSVPESAMLQVTDLGSGSWRVDPEASTGDWDLNFLLSACPAAKGLSWPEKTDSRLRNYFRQGGGGMVQEVHLFPAGGAKTFYDYHRQGAVACATFRHEFTGTELTLSILAEGFAGDRSMLVKASSAEKASVRGFVQVGNLVTQFTVHDGSVQTGKNFGAKAANRMCKAAETC